MRYLNDFEHEWEIGIGDVDEETVLKCVENDQLSLVHQFRNDLNLYHHFFVWKILAKKPENQSEKGSITLP
ncbi:MAG: hypothetical protein PHW11_07390 [Anaerolineaceae bacterium]|nr:hypothetical protein [Anaerolineaceae bacterium]MDD4042926.1 hypothetical protein [Anaerolineaceae bacterium]MDD4577361.1 hypothetical protein [Anaerolineaceae bacterium]